MESLDPRTLLTAAPLGVVVNSFTTSDSQSVTINYDVTTPDPSGTMDLGIYRSSDSTFDASDSMLMDITLTTSGVGTTQLDDNGQPAAAPGHHELKVAIPGGLSIDPDQPYVLAVAGPSTEIGAPDAASRVASIHTHVIGVVTHGGIQYKHDDLLGPPWQRQMSASLTAQGYDKVISFVWAADSRTPGKAKNQAPRLARYINKVASEFPDGDPVDIHFIGHSEGVVVNSQADQLLEQKEAPQIAAGFIKMTMIDPHAATAKSPSGQYSVSGGIIGGIAQKAIDWYQFASKDPLAAVPANVDQGEVFYQHTPVNQAKTNSGIYNLWGQVPVRGTATYYDITGPGMSHEETHKWYQDNVVPTLHDGGHFVNPDVLTGQRELGPTDREAAKLSTSNSTQPVWTGTAAPGATIKIFGVRGASKGPLKVGESTANAQGNWSITASPLATGQFRFLARSSVPESSAHPNVQVWHRLRLGTVRVTPAANRLG